MRDIMVLVGTALCLAACSDQAESDADGPVAQNAGTPAGSSPDKSAKPEKLVMTAAQFSELARKQTANTQSWQPDAEVEITGKVSEMILDEPQNIFVSFGKDPVNVDVFAEMNPSFNERFSDDSLYDPQGNVTVRCSGPVTKVPDNNIPVISACDGVFAE